MTLTIIALNSTLSFVTLVTLGACLWLTTKLLSAADR